MVCKNPTDLKNIVWVNLGQINVTLYFTYSNNTQKYSLFDTI